MSTESHTPEDGHDIDRYWHRKLELDILQECWKEPLTVAEIMEGFMDEEGDSTTNRDELAALCEGLAQSGLLSKNGDGAAARYATAREGKDFVRRFWPEDGGD